LLRIVAPPDTRDGISHELERDVDDDAAVAQLIAMQAQRFHHCFSNLLNIATIS
jgi:hypothetical protein